MTREVGTVLVTGATTPVVRAIIDAFRGDRVPRTIVWAGGVETVAPRPVESGVRYVHADLTSRRGVRALLFGEHGLDVDTIVHGPLQANPWAQEQRVHRLDVQSTRELLDAAEEHPSLRSFVFRSSADVYRLDRDEPRLIGEDEPLDLSSGATTGHRSLVEADVTVCTRIANSRLRLVVLRFAEILSPGCAGQLHDYLSSRVCLRPLGYDPMINVLSERDAANAVLLAATKSAAGVFNVPGLDTLPLSELVHGTGRLGVPLPGPLLTPLYRARSLVTSGRFRYSLEEMRFHYGAILDGARARSALGYVPAHPVELGELFTAAALRQGAISNAPKAGGVA